MYIRAHECGLGYVLLKMPWLIFGPDMLLPKIFLSPYLAKEAEIFNSIIKSSLSFADCVARRADLPTRSSEPSHFAHRSLLLVPENVSHCHIYSI